MRLNADKCKIINFKKREQPSFISLADSHLEIVPCYKYLGIDITETLDSRVYWERISATVRQNIYLLKQLKSNGLEEKILVVALFKSLVLSDSRVLRLLARSLARAHIR